MLEYFRKEMPNIHKIILTKICMKIVSVSQKKYLTGGNPLNVRSGNLRNRMYYKLISNLKARVGNNLKYAKVHESKNVADRTILPKNKPRLYIPLHRGAKKYQKGMKFGVDFVFAKKVVMPLRQFIKPAITDVIDGGMINSIISAEIERQAEIGAIKI